VDLPELVGSLVALRPLSEEHIADLLEAARDRSSYAYTTVPDGRRAMEEYVLGLIAARKNGETIPLAQICRRSESCVGVTRFLNIRVEPPGRSPYAVEIGGTWLAGAAQRTGINVDAKLQLLRHAFETWRRASFGTGSRLGRAARRAGSEIRPCTPSSARIGRRCAR